MEGRKRLPSAAQPRSARARFDRPLQLELADAMERVTWDRLHADVTRQEQHAAEDAFDRGTLLNQLQQAARDRGDEAAFETALAIRYEPGVEDARDCMRIARSTTRLLAGVYGITRLRLGVVLMEYFELKRLDQLESIDLPVRDADGVAVRFPATAGLLRSAIRNVGRLP